MMIVGLALGMMGALSSLAATRWRAKRVVDGRSAPTLALLGPASALLAVALAIPLGKPAVWTAAAALIVGRLALVGWMTPKAE